MTPATRAMTSIPTWPMARFPPQCSRAGITYVLVALKDVGLFYVNGQLITRLDLSHNVDFGTVSAMSGFFNDRTGEPEFENFNVWTP